MSQWLHHSLLEHRCDIGYSDGNSVYMLSEVSIDPAIGSLLEFSPLTSIIEAALSTHVQQVHLART